MIHIATLNKKYQTAPVQVLEIDIPDHLTDNQRARYAAHKLMKMFSIHIDPVPDIVDIDFYPVPDETSG